MNTNVHKLLMQARMALHAKSIKKSGRNTFANYSYMELADFLIPTQTIFSELGLCGVVSFTSDVATLTITAIEDGSQIVITSPMGSAALKGCHEVQNVGAVETYQRRYLWVTAMEIVEHDALDSGPPTDKTLPEVALEKQLEQSIAQASKKKNGAMGDAWAEAERNLAPEVKRSLRKFADRIAPMPPAEAFELLEEQGLEPEEKTFLWGFLDSKLRSALKHHRETQQLMKATQ